MKKIKLMLVFLLLFTSVVFGQYSARLIYFENDTIVVNPTDYPLKFNNAYDIIALLAMDSTWAVITVDTLLAKSPNGNDSLLIYLTNSSSIFKSSLPIYIGESGSGGLPGYSKKKLVTVPAIVSETTNLNVRVNVTYDSDMETDFKDIQFTELDGTLIDQFRESYVSATSSIWWIEIPTCPAAGWTGYMYYDNSGASLSSDGDATFVLFDDFFGTDGDSPNATKWRTTAAGGGSYSDIQDSTLRVHMETGIEIFVDSQDSLDEGFGIRARLKQDDTSKYPSRYVGFGDGSIYNHQIYYRYYEVGTASWGAYGGATKAAGDMALNTWEIYEIRREKSDTCRYWQDTSEDSLQNQAAANFTDSVRVIFGMKQTTWSPTMNLYVDWVFAIRLPGVSVGGSGDEFEAATLGAEIGSYGEVYLGNTTVLGNLVATSYETSVSGTEVTYLDGVSSSIQDQMDTKATTTYVNEIAANLRWKKEVKVATTANVTLSGEQTIDDSLTAESRILVKSQTDSTQNGVYVTAAGAWSRAVDLNEGFEINASVTRVLEGTVNANKSFVNTNIDSVDIGVTKITYAIFDGGLYSAGDGIAFTGGVISTDNKQAHVDTVGSSGNNLEIEADTVMVDIMQGATGAVKIKGSIDPTDSSSHDLGREDFPWKELWVKGLTTDGDTVRIFLPLKVTSDITASTIDATFDTVSASAFVGASDFVIGASGENVTVNVDSIKGDLVLGADWDNTDNPWADNEVANDITASNYEPLIGTLLTLDTLRIADNSNADTSLFHDDGDTLHIDSENYVSFNNRVYMREHLMLKESMHSGVDDVIVGAVRCYGGTGFVGGTIQLYSGATWDTETDFWRIYPNEDYLLFRDDYHAALKLKPDSLIVTGDVVATNILYKEDSTGTGADSYSTRTALVDTASNHWTELNVRCLESILGTSLGTGLTLDGTVLKASTGLQSLSGLTLTAGDMAIATGANTWNVLDAGATTKILVGGGAGNPVWTEATGTGAPVRAGSPTFTTKITSPEVDADSLINGDHIKANSGQGLKLTEDSGVGIFIKDGGNIGIGTETPNILLHVHNGILGISDENTDAQIVVGDAIGFGNGTYGYIEWDRTFDLLQFGHSTGGIKMSLMESGNIGMGTTTPGTTLEIAGNIANAAHPIVTIVNDDTTLTGETGQTSDVIFEMLATDDDAVSYTNQETGKISSYKISDYFHASDETDQDAGLKLYTVTDGSYVLNTTFSDDGIALVGDLGVGGDVVSTGDIRGSGDGSGLPYGSCYAYHMNWSQANAVQNTWYNISDADFTDGELNAVAHDGNGKLTVTNAGRYLINVSCDFENNVANDHVEIGFEISESGSATAQGIVCTETKFADEEHILFTTAILDLAASATVELAIRTTDNNTPTLTADCANITCTYLGGT